jgi:transcriptional regulator with XRE-family HTH domain
MSEEQWREEFSKKLSSKMSVEGVNQLRLAKRSGISEASISKYISGTQTPKVYALMRIAKALNASIFELIPFSR